MTTCASIARVHGDVCDIDLLGSGKTPAADWITGKVSMATAQSHITPEFRAKMKDLYPNGLFLNSGLNGQHKGWETDLSGYAPNSAANLWGLLAATPLYRMTISERYPLMWIGSDCRIWLPIKPGTKMTTDWGSIPVIVRWKFDPEEAIWFLFHDGAYHTHGLWILLADCAKPVFMCRSREWVDESLRIGYMCQWGRSWPAWSKARQIWAAVRAGGWVPWGRAK